MSATNTTVRRRGAPPPERRFPAGDAGTTLVEMLVVLAVLSVLMSAFFLVYLGFTSSADSTTAYSIEQGQTRNAVRVLESDVQSGDPLTVVPSSFTLDPNGVAASSGTSSDVLGMYEDDDRYSPCPTGAGASPSTVPSPLLPSSFAPNVIWAYDPGARTLTRYSYCSSTKTWTKVLSLGNVSSSAASGTVFIITSSSVGAQVATVSPTVVPNQAAPLCATAVTIALRVAEKGQQVSFVTRVLESLPNEPQVLSQAC